jgi:hypothetical protein
LPDYLRHFDAKRGLVWMMASTTGQGAGMLLVESELTLSQFHAMESNSEPLPNLPTWFLLTRREYI